MAIAQTGTTSRFTLGTGAANAGTLSATITVPADAEIAIVVLSGFNASATYYSNGTVTFTKGAADTAMTLATAANSTSFSQGFIWYLAVPDTGSNKSLKYDWEGAGTVTDDTMVTLRFYKGIDTASPVRDADDAQASGLPYTTPTLTAQTNDLIVAIACFFPSGGEGTIDTWSNLTLSEQITSAGSTDQAWAHGTPTGDVAVAASTGTNVGDGGIVAIVIKAAAEASTAAVFAAMSPSIAIASRTVAVAY